MVQRNFRLERDFWLDHFFQLDGRRRPDPAAPINPALDTVPAPPSSNLPAPLAGVCLVWRWSLSADGYGYPDGKIAAHRLAYEQARGERLSPERLALHICNRPFCIQPAHLYEGTAKHNAEDRIAVRRQFALYQSIGETEYHFDRAFNAALYPWPAPPAAAPATPTLPETSAVECPHGEIRHGHCVNCQWSAGLHCRRHCFHSGLAGELWPCRCAAVYCPCGIALLSDLPGKPYDCPDCQHLVVDAEFIDGVRPLGHSDCPAWSGNGYPLAGRPPGRRSS